jgi:hypothetical protein
MIASKEVAPGSRMGSAEQPPSGMHCASSSPSEHARNCFVFDRYDHDGRPARRCGEEK